jgi:hypothetical protein
VKGLLSQRYSRLLLVVALLLSTAGLLVELQFHWVVSRVAGGAQPTAQVFANVDLALNLFALAEQGLRIPMRRRVFGVDGRLVIILVVLIRGAGLVAITTAARPHVPRSELSRAR